MSVDTNATNFQLLPKALSDANTAIYESAMDGVDEVRQLDSEYVDDDETGKRLRIRSSFVHKAADTAASHLKSCATSMALLDGSAASEFCIDVLTAKLRLRRAVGNPSVKGSFSKPTGHKGPPELSLTATVNARGPSLGPSGPGASRQMASAGFKCNLEFDGEDWKPVNASVADNTLVPDASQSGASRDSHAARE